MKRAHFTLLLLLSSSPYLLSQQIPAIASGSPGATLPGHIPPVARRATDQGPVDPTKKIHYVSLIFNKTPEQKLDIERLTASQRDPKSADFRRWLTPAQYAERFGIDADSMRNVRSWLESQGFIIDSQSASRTSISFSGTASQIDNSFRTELHTYKVGDKIHFAPTREPSVPEPLRPAILAIRGLDDFYGEHVRTRAPIQKSPDYSSGGGGIYLTPDDIATIYDIAPLYAAGFDGTGQTIAIVGASNVSLTDIADFRTKFGLPAKAPQIIAVGDPGVPDQVDSEPALDLELSGAIARGADQIFVYSTNFADAASYAIDKAVAPVLSMSFHNCENNFTPAEEATLASMGQEAAAKGITWIVAAGDSGPADCDAHDVSGTVAQDGIYVNGWAAIPEVTAVGGTEFNEAGSASWNAVNGNGFSSATGYINETVWNDGATAGYLAAGGGGSSQYFRKPPWQAGAAGVPTDGARDVPDIALAASWFHDGYYLCYEGICNGGHGGTSAATPVFAGLTAMLNQFLLKWGVLPVAGLGNINPTLYKIAQPSTRPSPAFHDIVNGSNTVTCLAGSPDCGTGSYGYSAGPNYDLASGLGSVDATQLFNAWLALNTSAVSTTTTVTLPPPPFGTSLQITVTVTGASGTAPAGSVYLSAGGTPLGSAPLLPQLGMSTVTFTLFSSQLPAGVTTIGALYAGNSEYLPSAGTASISQAGPAAATPSIQVFANPDPVYETPSAYGSVWNFTMTVREVNGAQANLAGFKVNATDTTKITGQPPLAVIMSWLGTTTVPAYGSISVPLQLTENPTAGTMTLTPVSAFGSGANVPTITPLTVLIADVARPGGLTLELDIPGVTPTSPLTPATATVPLLARPNGASLQLTGSPNTVMTVTGASCQWSQQLLLRELAGTGVNLTSFIAGGTDMSARIASLWGATSIAASGGLTAVLCWSGITPPVLIDYSIGGTDQNGNAVSATLTTPFLSQSSSGNSLSVFPANAPMPPVTTMNLNSLNNQLILNVTTGSKAWTAAVATSGQNPGWLTIHPVSGSGNGGIYVTPVSGLASGTYKANVLVQAIDAVPQLVSIPVVFTVQ